MLLKCTKLSIFSISHIPTAHILAGSTVVVSKSAT